MTFLEDIFNSLNRLANYAVLRNHEGLPNNYRSRDIDLLIDKKQYKKMRPVFQEISEHHRFEILVIYKAAGHHSIFFQSIDDLKDIIQFDFLFNVSVQGILLADSKLYLENRLSNGSVYYLPNSLTFLNKYLYNRLLGYDYPEKYKDLKWLVITNYAEELEKWIIYTFGNQILNFQNVEKCSCRKLRNLATKQGYRNHGLKQGLFFLHYVICTFSNLIHPQGLFLSFTGPDGVGKTTVLNIIGDAYKQVWNGDAVQVHHSRPDALPRLAVLLHHAGAVKTVDKDFDKPHRGRNSGFFGSFLRLFYYMADYQIGYWRKIFPRRFHRQVTIYDRYYSDIVIDSQRSNIKLPYKIIYILGKLIPQPEYSVFVTADEEVILSRKQELTKDEIHQIQNIISWMAKTNKKFIRVENNGPAEETADMIMEEILRKQNHKYKTYFQR